MTPPNFAHVALRRRILGTLAASSLVAVACGGDTTPNTPTTASSSGGSSGASGSSGGASSSGATDPTCRDGKPKRQCWTANAIITKSSGYGGVRDPDAAPPPPPTREANGCVVLDEVMNGCCNPAVSGPVVENGECCYEFCEGACCGRPLVVAGAARIARPVDRDDWAALAHVRRTELDARTRTALRDAWTRDALLEHASIASFAVFTLELLALGAPPDLVRDAQSATADEIEHARLTFAVASVYSDEPVGPGRLDVGGIAPTSDLAAIAAACVRDGCINETLASAVAAAQASHALDPFTREALERIAEDEARHAELAWRFVQWALSRGDTRVRNAVLAAFDAPLRPLEPEAGTGIDAQTWRAHGRLVPEEHAMLLRSVHEQVIAPCRDRLLHRAHARPDGRSVASA